MDENEEFSFDGEDGHTSEELYGLIGFIGEPMDQHVHDLFWDVMYNDEMSIDERIAAYDELVEYLQDTYGMDFADLWDWESFREWYETA